ncbi:MAG: phosphatase PAP2 family protein [Oscillospiraceae bacterium]|nr:phosphatase PAP2 family protein [Oscillospiraceae bacterium]
MVCFIDVQPIGPQGSAVGFAAINRRFHQLTGVHLSLYILTDWLSLIPVAFAVGFALLGLQQWITRKKLHKVDRSILVLGGFYVAVAAAYSLFELFPVNYRPLLIEGELEASYPSSTTLLVLCIMPTAAMQLHRRIQNRRLRCGILSAIAVFTVFMVIGRLLSGVHWLSDIIGGALLSAAFVMAYHAISAQADRDAT